MRKLLLLFALIVAAAYAYHRFYGEGASSRAGEPIAASSPMASPIRRTTPKPTPHSTSLQTSHLGPPAPGAPTPRARDPLAAPHH